jgi:hypothetical protein
MILTHDGGQSCLVVWQNLPDLTDQRNAPSFLGATHPRELHRRALNDTHPRGPQLPIRYPLLHFFVRN